MREPETNNTAGRGTQSAEDGNTAAGAEDQTCSVPLQSAFCKNPSRGENTFKHTLFSSLKNISWAQRLVQVSFGWIWDLPFAPRFVKQNIMPYVMIQKGAILNTDPGVLTASNNI